MSDRLTPSLSCGVGTANSHDVDQNGSSGSRPAVKATPNGRPESGVERSGSNAAESDAFSHKRKYYLLPGQLYVQITSDVDLDKLGQPHLVRHECEPLDQPVLDLVGEMNDAPSVQWSQFIAANRMLNVKERLSHTGAKKVAVPIGMFRCSDERNFLLLGVERDLLQDQPILHRLKPKALLR